MDVQENCIQLKIDTIISDINQNNQDNQNEEKNQITALMGYSHCLDLFDFLQIFSKIQKNELLVQIALIFDSIGYTELSMDYINESLLLIPNVPSVILYKSGLFACINKLDEAQKWLLKYKYLIGENKYDNYIHDSFLVVFYYLLEYEEYIILRKIESIENKYTLYAKENIVLFFIKSKIFEKLAEKIKNSDKKRYVSFIKEIEEINNKYINNKKNECEFLFEQGIKNETITKLLILIYPNLLNYKPKKLTEYNNNFNNNGFSVFYTLIKICKILKLKIEAKKYIKLISKKRNNNYKTNKLNSINDVIKNIQEFPSNDNSNNIIDEDIKNCQESINNLSNNIWLKGYINKNNGGYTDIKVIKPKNLDTNYFIKEGYYSHLNLKECILKNIEYNNNYKKNSFFLDSFINEINHDVKTIIGDNSLNKNNNNIKDSRDSKGSKDHKDSKDSIKNVEQKINKNNNNIKINNEISKINKKEIKKVDSNSNKIKTKRIKNSLSDIIKKIIINHNKNKRNRIYNNDNKESKKPKKFCSTDNCNNQAIIKNNNLKKKIEIKKSETNSLFNIKDSDIIHKQKEEEKEKEKQKQKEIKKKENEKNKEKELKNDNKEIMIKEEDNKENKIIPNDKKSNSNLKNTNRINKFEKKNQENDKMLKNVNSISKLLTANISNKNMEIFNSNEQNKVINKKNQNLIYSSKEEKKMDTDYGKYKDIREINLVSYCLKQLIKKKENKNKNIKNKEIANLTDKIEFGPHKLIDFEKQILQINEQKNAKAKSKKKNSLNKSIKKKINTFTFEKKKNKNKQKNSDNNLLNNRSSFINKKILINKNLKNFKKTINNYGYKKELSKFKSLNYLQGNIFSNNNYLNINFNNYLNYNFNYSNRHEYKKNFDLRFNPNSDNKKRESNSKEKFNYRTINFEFKNISSKIINIKKPLLNSFIDSKDKNKKSSDNKNDFIIMPFYKIKNSPSGETNCLKKKLKNLNSNIINTKKKSSFSKYMFYNINKKNDGFYFSKSINTSEYNRFKNSSIKSKTMKSGYNKTIANKTNSKIIKK